MAPSLQAPPVFAVVRQLPRLRRERIVAASGPAGLASATTLRAGVCELVVQSLGARGRPFLALVEPLAPVELTQHMERLRGTCGGLPSVPYRTGRGARQQRRPVPWGDREPGREAAEDAAAASTAPPPRSEARSHGGRSHGGARRSFTTSYPSVEEIADRPEAKVLCCAFRGAVGSGASLGTFGATLQGFS